MHPDGPEKWGRDSGMSSNTSLLTNLGHILELEETSQLPYVTSRHLRTSVSKGSAESQGWGVWASAD